MGNVAGPTKPRKALDTDERTVGDESADARTLRADNERLKAELADLHESFEYILEASMAGWWDWRIQDGTEYLSPSFKRLFGYEDHEMANTPEAWQEIMFQEDLPGVFKVFDDHIASRGEIPYDNKVRYHHKDGRTVWVYCRGKVIEWDDEGKPIRMIGNHVDITELVELQHQLTAEAAENEALAHELAQRNAELDQFAYAVAHDVRGPLSTARSLLELALRKDDPEETRELATVAHKETERLQRIVDGLMALARLRGTSLGRDKVDLTEIATKAFHDEGVNDLDVASLGTTIGDDTLLSQVFTNLASNARRYQGDEPLRVTIKRDGNTITVTDNGQGFDPRLAETLFDPFRRGTTEHDGIGLGLALCRRIMEAHGGNITATGEPGVGATFHIHLHTPRNTVKPRKNA